MIKVLVLALMFGICWAEDSAHEAPSIYKKGNLNTEKVLEVVNKKKKEIQDQFVEQYLLKSIRDAPPPVRQALREIYHEILSEKDSDKILEKLSYTMIRFGLYNVIFKGITDTSHLSSDSVRQAYMGYMANLLNENADINKGHMYGFQGDVVDLVNAGESETKVINNDSLKAAVYDSLKNHQDNFEYTLEVDEHWWYDTDIDYVSRDEILYMAIYRYIEKLTTEHSFLNRFSPTNGDWQLNELVDDTLVSNAIDSMHRHVKNYLDATLDTLAVKLSKKFDGLKVNKTSFKGFLSMRLESSSSIKDSLLNDQYLDSIISQINTALLNLRKVNDFNGFAAGLKQMFSELKQVSSELSFKIKEEEFLQIIGMEITKNLAVAEASNVNGYLKILIPYIFKKPTLDDYKTIVASVKKQLQSDTDFYGENKRYLAHLLNIVEHLDNYVYVNSSNKLDIKIEPALVELSKSLKKRRNKYFEMLLDVGMNYSWLDNKDENGSVQFVSEKIGLRFKLWNWKYTWSHKPNEWYSYHGCQYRGSNKGVPYFSDIYLTGFASGLLYNISYLNSDDTFNQPIVGGGLGVTFSNDLRVSINRIYRTGIKHDQWGWALSLDVDIVEYISALAE